MRKIIILALVFCGQIIFAQPLVWQETGGLYGCTANAIAQDHDGILYVGTSPPYSYGIGLYRSLDSGASWIHGAEGIPQGDFGYGREVGALAVSPVSGDIFCTSYTASSSGVFRSSNHGESWQQINEVSTVYGFSFGPDSLIGAYSGRTVYLSQNDGHDWIAHVINNIPNGSDINYFAICNAETLLAISEYHLYRSTDHGASWSTFSGNLPSDLFFECLGRAPNGVLYLRTLQSIYASSDCGSNWAELQLSQQLTNSETQFYLLNDSLMVFLTDVQGFLLCNLVDHSCRFLNNNLPMISCSPYDIYPIATGFVQVSNGDIFASTYQPGVMKYSASQDRWSEINVGIEEHVVSTMTTLPNGRVLAGGFGLYVSDNHGQTWEPGPLITRNTGILLDFLVSPSGTTYAADDANGILESNDNGQSWELTDCSEGCTSIAIDGSGRLYRGRYYDGPQYYNPETNTWQELGTWSNGLGAEKVFAIPSRQVLVSTRILRLLHRLTAGGFWQPIGLGTGGYECLLPLPNDSLLAGTYWGIEMSSDSGTHFRTIQNIGWVRDLQYDGRNIIYAASDSGVYRSADLGNHWENISGNLPDTSFSSLTIDSAGYLYVSNYRGKIYRTASSLGNSDSHEFIPQSIRLLQSYPNPFNNSTTISFSVPKSERVVVKIYEVIGREIINLADKVFQAGEHKLQFDGTNLPSGIYFAHLQAGEFITTQKMVLLK